MNIITQDMKFRQALIKYSYKYGVTYLLLYLFKR